MVNFSFFHGMKAYTMCGGIAPFILNLRRYIDVSGQYHAPTALPPEMNRGIYRMGG